MADGLVVGLLIRQPPPGNLLRARSSNSKVVSGSGELILRRVLRLVVSPSKPGPVSASKPGGLSPSKPGSAGLHVPDRQPAYHGGGVLRASPSGARSHRNFCPGLPGRSG